MSWPGLHCIYRLNWDTLVVKVIRLSNLIILNLSSKVQNMCLNLFKTFYIFQLKFLLLLTFLLILRSIMFSFSFDFLSDYFSHIGKLLFLYGSLHSVQFGRSVVSDILWPHEPHHARPPCPSPTPGVHPNPCPLRRWCHPTISSSVVPFSSCLQSFPASGSFQMSQLFTSGGQSTGISASTSLLPMNTQDLN